MLRPVPNAVSVSLPSPVGVNKPGRELTQGKGWDFPDKIFNQFHRRGFIIISNRHSFNALYDFRGGYGQFCNVYHGTKKSE